MPKVKNAVWRFFASVKLALITLIILATVSIIGSVIKQGQPPSFYLQEYGPGLARILDIMDLTDMYSSWWFVAVFTLFAINLVICSIERLPETWRMVRRDNLATDPEQMEKMSSKHVTASGLPPGTAADRMQQILVGAGWKNPRRLELEGSVLLFTQKGAWTRLAVYLVHLSMLVIFAGAIIGNVFGYKASVYVKEGRSTQEVYLDGSNEPMPLGFEVECDRFEMSYYPNGMVREYRSDLVVYDPERKAPYHKSIIVNDPLTYRGISFYQAASGPLQEYSVVLRNQASGSEQAFRVPADRDVTWPGTSVSFRIEELQKEEDNTVHQAKIRLVANAIAEPAVFWIKNKDTVSTGAGGENFTVSFRQLYVTQLRVAKDPGVLLVYFGCLLMVVGLAVSFVLSHRRIWIYIAPAGKQGTRILVSGTSNKNKPTFERQFQELVTGIKQDAATSCRPPKGS